MLPQVRQIQVKDYELGRVQQAVVTQLNLIGRVPFLDGVLFENVSVNSSTATTITHGLNRTPIGYLVVDSSAAANVYTVSKSASQLVLLGSSSSTISLWIF